MPLYSLPPAFGALPAGAHLKRIRQSPNYSNGSFQNQIPTSGVTFRKPAWRTALKLLFNSPPHLKPSQPLPVIKTNLAQLPLHQNSFVWLGHSTLFFILEGLRLVSDPVFNPVTPIGSFNKPFAGPDIYNAPDVPETDYLILTHDHYDHLDYKVIRQLAPRVKAVICPLGVGAHLIRWGMPAQNITELDWHQSIKLKNGITFTALPARHFSGRGLSRNKTLWFSYLLQGPFGQIYHSGDSGMAPHFKEIKDKYGKIDFAFIENGQSDINWEHIHMLPHQVVQAVEIIKPEAFIGIHNSKYAIAKHPWYQPMEYLYRASLQNNLPLLMPQIGQPVAFGNYPATTPWWQPLMQQELSGK